LTWGSSISDKIAIGRLAGWTGNQWQGDILHAALWRDTLTPYQVHAVYLALREQLSRIVYFGDSITDGTGASDDAHRWRSIVSAAMGYISSINSGVASTTLQNTAQNSVDTIGDAVDDNGYDTCYERVFVYQPGKVAILYGLNDLRLNDEAFSVTAFQNQLLEIVNALAESGLRPANVYIGSPPYIPEDSYADYEPWDGGSREKHDQYRDACANVAASSGAHFVDVYQYMTDNGDDDLIDEDGIHPNDDGHAAIAAAFLAEMA
jgi:lysophospholipase L1-like esterase